MIINKTEQNKSFERTQRMTELYFVFSFTWHLLCIFICIPWRARPLTIPLLPMRVILFTNRKLSQRSVTKQQSNKVLLRSISRQRYDDDKQQQQQQRDGNEEESMGQKEEILNKICIIRYCCSNDQKKVYNEVAKQMLLSNSLINIQFQSHYLYIFMRFWSKNNGNIVQVLGVPVMFFLHFVRSIESPRDLYQVSEKNKEEIVKKSNVNV